MSTESLFSMEGRVAIVTGGSKGIGLAIADALAQAGASVTIAARDPETLAEAVKGLSAHGNGAHGVSADVASREGIEQVVAESVEKFGFVDTLVNNIGGSRGPGFENRPLPEIDDALFDNSMQYNVKSHLFAAQLCAPMMQGRGKGSIVNIASTSGRPFLMPLAYGAVYSMAKAAVIQLTISMAIEWSPTIRANCICPGLVLTRAGLARTTEDQRAAAISRMVMDRSGDASDFAGAGLFLASDASSWITGTVIDVNGGAGLRAAYVKSLDLSE